MLQAEHICIATRTARWVVGPERSASHQKDEENGSYFDKDLWVVLARVVPLASGHINSRHLETAHAFNEY